MKSTVELRPLASTDESAFITDLQEAFSIAINREFGPQTQPSAKDYQIKAVLAKPNTDNYFIYHDNVYVGGAIIEIDESTQINKLDLMYLKPEAQSLGIGMDTWLAIEALYPDTKIWEVHTPYYEKRNIHFYVNKCGFHIVEFFSPIHPNPHGPNSDREFEQYFFRFQKEMKK